MSNNRHSEQAPSPLAGEGGERRGREPGEGEGRSTKARARSLRRKMTDAERKLWHMLRSRRLAGAKFRRQVPLGAYIVDFLSYEARLILEADGSQHIDSTRDKYRDDWLKRQGYTILRHSNRDVLKTPDAVLAQIMHVLDGLTPHPAPSAPPSPTRGEGKLLRMARKRNLR